MLAVPTAADLRRRAAELERQAAALRRAADDLDNRAATALALSKRSDSRIMSEHMEVDTTGQPTRVRIGASRVRRDHPAIRAWYAAGMTVTAVAKEIGENRLRVSAWLFDGGPRTRAIPEKHVQFFESKYGIPRTVWARIQS